MTESGKIVTATVLSVLAHVSLFTVLALVPEASLEATPPPSLEEAAEAPERPLEVTLEIAAPQPAPQPEETPVHPAATAEQALLAHAQALRTQLDPENLSRADEAPEHATTLAAYNSKATQQSAATALPTPAPEPSSADLSIQTSRPTATPGEIGIDALGHYGKAVGNAIGVRWNLHRNNQSPPLAVGEVRVQFVLDAQGRISDTSVLSNTAGPANAAVACKAVQEAKIPPIPPDRLAQLPGGRMRIVYSFTIYSSQ